MKISNEVANMLANSKINGQELYLPDGQLDRKLYMAVNKVLVAQSKHCRNNRLKKAGQM